MRHTDPKDSSVFQEFERIAAERGWVKEAALEPGIADQIRKEVNAVATMLPKTNAVLDLLIPVAETGGDNTELRHALDALRASVMDPFLAKGFDDQGGEARSLYHSARSMLHAPEGQGHLWLNGLLAMRELLTKYYGQEVGRSVPVPQEVDTELAPAEMGPPADDGLEAHAGLMDDDIQRMWRDLSEEQKKALLPSASPTYMGMEAAQQFLDYFNKPENLDKLRKAWFARGPSQRWEELQERFPGPEKKRAPVDAKWFVDPLVGQVQGVLKSLGENIKADNAWGPLTNAAWNRVVGLYGLDKQYGLKLMPEIFPGDQSSPSRKEMEFMAKHGRALSAIEGTGTRAERAKEMAEMGGKAPTGPSPVETGPMPPEHIPAGYPADDGMLEAVAAVTGELVSLANDFDAMGESEAAEAIDEQLKLYKEAADKLYDITGETGEQLVGKAHPGGGPTVAPSQEEGGKVETIVEEQKKALKVVQKQPTGKQAFIANQLVALANRLDSEDKTEAAMLVDKTLDEMRRASRLPFVGNLRKEGEKEKKEFSVTLLLSGIADDLDEVEGHVEDQTFMTAGDPDVIWRGTNYESEYDEFVEAARKYFEGRAQESYNRVGDTVWLQGVVKDAVGMMAALGIIRKFYAEHSGPPTLGIWKPPAEHAYLRIVGYVNQLKKKVGWGKPGKMEAARPGKPGKGKVPAAGPANDSLQHTVSKIVKSIDAAYRGGATDRNLLDATFKSIDIPGVTTPGTRGLRKALEVLKRAKSMQGKVYDEVDAQDYNDWLFNKILTPMKKGLKIVGSAGEEHLVKTAKARPPPEFGGGKAPAKRRGRGRRGRARGGPVRQDVMALQGLMERLGYDLGTAGVDGKWGRYTAGAWEKLRKDVAAMKGPALPAAAPAKSKGPSASAVKLAGQAASYLLSVKGEAGRAVTLAPGIKIQESALANPQAFVKALGRIPASGVRFMSRRDMFSKENLAKATDLLTKYQDALRKPGSPEAWAIWTKGGGAPALKRRLQVVESLLAQLPRAGAKVPPMGYGYEGGRLPFGTLEGGPGGKPGMPGVPGVPGLRGRPGYSAYFDPRSLVLEFQRILPDDLLDIMADTRMFMKYANNVWDRGRKMKAAGKDSRVVALAFVDFLGDRLGTLRRRLTPAISRRLGRQAQAIKDRIMRAFSYMSTLEDELKHGSSL